MLLGCGNAIGNGGSLSPDASSLCNMPCKGNTAETCGGSNGLNVYEYGASTPTSSISTSALTPTSMSASTPTATPTLGAGKRGLAYNNNNPGANAEYANLFEGYSKVTWGYDWGYPSYGLSSSFELYVCFPPQDY